MSAELCFWQFRLPRPLVSLLSCALQVVDLTNNQAMSGSFAYDASDESHNTLCTSVQKSLRVLNMNGLGLTGLALPQCLFASGSLLQEARLGVLLSSSWQIFPALGTLPGLALPQCLSGSGRCCRLPCLVGLRACTSSVSEERIPSHG